MTDIPALLAQLATLLGPRGLLTEASDTAPFAEDWRKLYQGSTPAVIRPADTAELATAMKLCASAWVAVVPQGGNT